MNSNKMFCSFIVKNNLLRENFIITNKVQNISKTLEYKSMTRPGVEK